MSKIISEKIMVFAKSKDKLFYIGKTVKMQELKKFKDITGETHVEKESKMETRINLPRSSSPKDSIAATIKNNKNFTIYFISETNGYIEKSNGTLEDYLPRFILMSSYSTPEMLNYEEVSEFKKEIKNFLNEIKVE